MTIWKKTNVLTPESLAEVIAEHEADTTNVHGIDDTSVLGVADTTDIWAAIARLDDRVADITAQVGWDPIAADNDVATAAAVTKANDRGSAVLLPPDLKIAQRHQLNGSNLLGRGGSPTNG